MKIKNKIIANELNISLAIIFHFLKTKNLLIT